MNTLCLDKKIAIVTGASSGIGREIVFKFADAGVNVVIADVNEKMGNEIVKVIRNNKNSESVTFVKTDVANKKSIEDMVEKTKEIYGEIDILVNNAGILIPRLLVDPEGKEEASEEIWDKMVSINQKGAFFCAQAVSREMIKRGKGGVIINMSSECGLEGSEGQSIYAGTKAAMYAYTRSWAKELGKYNIRVVGIAPGILELTGLRSPAYEQALAYTRGITVETLRESYKKVSIPLGRVGKLEEVANTVLFLVSDMASYITGTVINISGGKSRA